MIAPHEPDEALHDAEEAFTDAANSEERWQNFALQPGVRSVLLEIPEEHYLALEKLAQQRGQNVPTFIEQVMVELLNHFVPSPTI